MKTKDIRIAKHAYYNTLKEAGVLRNGRIQIGEKIDNKHSKASYKKKLCRQKINKYDF